MPLRFLTKEREGSVIAAYENEATTAAKAPRRDPFAVDKDATGLKITAGHMSNLRTRVWVYAGRYRA